MAREGFSWRGGGEWDGGGGGELMVVFSGGRSVSGELAMGRYGSAPSTAAVTGKEKCQSEKRKGVFDCCYRGLA